MNFGRPYYNLPAIFCYICYDFCYLGIVGFPYNYWSRYTFDVGYSLAHLYITLATQTTFWNCARILQMTQVGYLYYSRRVLYTSHDFVDLIVASAATPKQQMYGWSQSWEGCTAPCSYKLSVTVGMDGYFDWAPQRTVCFLYWIVIAKLVVVTSQYITGLQWAS